MIVFDDFAETAVGDFPALDLEGGGNAAMSVVQRQGKKWFAADATDPSTFTSVAYLRLRAEDRLPSRFTIELDVAWPGAAYGIVVGRSCTIWTRPDGMWTNRTTTTLKPRTSAVEHISITVNGHYVKAYLGGQRTINDPTASTRTSQSTTSASNSATSARTAPTARRST